jgi:hypothetical protein
VSPFHMLFRRRGTGGLTVACAVAGLLVGSAVTASAAQRATASPKVCSGTAKSPGVLAGGVYHRSVVVKGVCFVDAGKVVVDGSVIIDDGGALGAAFAKNDKTGKGASSLTVRHNVVVRRRATLLLGCEPNVFTCLDDTGKTPSLTSRGTINGTLTATKALGVIVHSSSIGGAVTQTLGGGGLNCTPEGVFKAFNSPVYSDYEDDVFGSSVTITGLTSCWLGAIRNAVHGSMTVSSNKMADPDANEILANYVNKDLTCKADSPAVQYGDSADNPNVVAGKAAGQCRFGRRTPDPAPHGPLEPISLRATA